MISDPAEIRQLGPSKAGENQDFVRYLSAHHHTEERFQIIASEIQAHVDCKQCANCCRYSIVAVTHEDLERISEYVGRPVEDVVRQYTTLEVGGRHDRILKSTSDGCVFLDGNLCMIYDARPAACAMFPHAAKGAHTLGSRLSSHVRWASLCPIIYNAF